MLLLLKLLISYCLVYCIIVCAGGALAEHCPFGVQGEDRVNRGTGTSKRTTTNLQDKG